MKILRYKIEITTDVVHGWHSTIDEVYVPDIDLFINKETCFIGGEDNKDRVPKDFKDLFKVGAEEVSAETERYLCGLAKSVKERADFYDCVVADLFKE